MKKFCLIILFILIRICNPTYSSAATKDLYGIKFKVHNIQPALHSDNKPPSLTLDLIIYNATETRKIDITRNLNILLLDEFGNQYHCLTTNNFDKINDANSIQSLYPQQSYISHLAFEMPIAQAVKFILKLNSNLSGREDGTIVEIPFNMPQNDNTISISIKSPDNGSTVETGTLVHLSVAIMSNRLPDGIIINAFDYTYEDSSPTMNNIYDLNIPTDKRIIGTQSISVIAKWKENPGNNIETASDSILLHVHDSSSVVAF